MTFWDLVLEPCGYFSPLEAGDTWSWWSWWAWSLGCPAGHWRVDDFNPGIPILGGICDHWKCKWKWIQLSRVAIFLNYEFDVCLFQHATWLQWFWNLADAERKQETALRVWEARTWHLESFAWQLLHLDLSYKNQLYLKYTVVYLIPLKIFGVRVFDNPESLLGICLII